MAFFTLFKKKYCPLDDSYVHFRFLELKIFGDPSKISGDPLLGPGPVFENHYSSVHSNDNIIVQWAYYGYWSTYIMRLLCSLLSRII